MEPNPVPVAFLSEANPCIGTGHVVETLQLARGCSALGLRPHLWLTKETPDVLWRQAAETPCILGELDLSRIGAMVPHLRGSAFQAIVTNFRRITQDQICLLQEALIPVVCVDELGGRFLNPRVIVNNSIVAEFHQYPGTAARVYAGPEYMCIDEAYRDLGPRHRTFRDGIRSLAISMGGADRTRSTLRVVEALARWRPGVKKHVVAGPGFDFVGQLEGLMAGLGDDFSLHRSPPSLAPLLMRVDAGVTAGGNTLYEMACLGTPALVLYEDPHERLQGEAFAGHGFGVCLGSGAGVSREAILEGLTALSNPTVLSAHSNCGRRLVDGLGAGRILRIIREHALAN